MRVTAVHRAEFAAFRVLEAVVSGLSWPRRLAFGRAMGRLWYRVDRGHRTVATENLCRAFPDWSASRVEEVARANFEHLGATAAEFLGLSGETPEGVLARCRFEGLAGLDEAVALGRGVFVLSGHQGNWELVGSAVSARGYPLWGVGRRMKNPLADRKITALRQRFGATVIPHRDAVRPVLRVLKAGGLVGFLLDQRASGREAVMSRFFGKPVATNQGLALLALKTGAPVVTVFGERVGDEHVVRFGGPLEAPAGGSRDDRVQQFTRAFDAAVEAEVRRRPEQWFWVHRRWRLPRELVS